jgi:hypothetical protein
MNRNIISAYDARFCDVWRYRVYSELMDCVIK